MLIYLQSSSWFSMSPSGSQPLVGPCCCLHTNVDLPGRVGLPVSKLCTESKEARTRNIKEGNILGINMMCKAKANLICFVDLHDPSATSMYVYIYIYTIQFPGIWGIHSIGGSRFASIRCARLRWSTLDSDPSSPTFAVPYENSLHLSPIWHFVSSCV